MISRLDLFNVINQNKSYEDVINCVKNIFEEILRDRWDSKFYLHPLGFYYCRIAERQGNQIRLHIWEANYSMKKDLFIHDHYYDLCSWILVGKILDYTYSVLPAKGQSAYTKFISDYINNENNRTLNRTDEFQNIEQKGERILRKGEKYFINKETYHSNKVLFDESQITATLVYTFNHSENHSPKVIGLSVNEYYLEDNPLPISENKIKEIIEIVKKEIFSN